MMLSRRLGSEEVSQRLKSTLQVLKYITSKDIFMQIYQTTLARRLILGLSVDSDLEEEMCRWLANVGMPAEVINRINRMFGDVRVSEDLSKLTVRQSLTYLFCRSFPVELYPHVRCGIYSRHLHTGTGRFSDLLYAGR